MDIEPSRPFGNVVRDIYVFHRFASIVHAAGAEASITKAARKLGLSSTGLLQCLKRLEEEYDTPLIETQQRTTGVRITDAGRVVLEESAQIFTIHNQMRAKVSAAAGHGPLTETITLSSSPYLLAHVFPEAVSSYVQTSPNAANCRIECEEGYYTDQIIERIESKALDFAVVWNYPEKVDKLRNTTLLVTCATAGRRIDPVVVFGKDHPFKGRLEQEDPSVYIEELANEMLFVLEPHHQPLWDKILELILHSSVKHNEFTTFASIIGSIRAGMRGVAILPGIFKDLDKYRRDGSLYFLPLRSRAVEALQIEILYLFRGKRPKSWGTDGIRPFKEFSAVQMTKEAKSFLEYIENTVLPGLPERSAWWPEPSSGGVQRQSRVSIEEVTRNLDEFVHLYHISPDRVGLDEPQWHRATLRWNGRLEGDQAALSGEMTLCKVGAEGCRDYLLKGELVGKQVLMLKGDCLVDGHPTDRDSFVATFNYVSYNGDHLIGVLSGRDDSGLNDLTCSCVLSKLGPSAVGRLDWELHVARNHMMLEEEVKAFRIADREDVQ